MRDTRRRRERDESRERRRNRSRDRERNRGQRSRDRERTRSRDRGRARSEGRREQLQQEQVEPPILNVEDFEGKSSKEIEMMKIMGFANFDTSKNKKVKGNDSGDIHVSLKRKYRQYMNRKGGFNRPLDAIL